MDRDQAQALLEELTHGASLLRHARCVEISMRACAARNGQDPDPWGLAGLLHDADYEAHPDEHPNVIVNRLREAGEESLAYAISAHYTKWGVEAKSLMDKALIACDELTGFIVACALVRPTKIVGLTPKSVKKKLKDARFAAKVERDEIYAGIELLGVDIGQHIQMIIDALLEHKDELELA